MMRAAGPKRMTTAVKLGWILDIGLSLIDMVNAKLTDFHHT
jgi:hypothetical protein